MNEQNTFQMEISENIAITSDHIKILFTALCYRKYKYISVEANDLINLKDKTIFF